VALSGAREQHLLRPAAFLRPLPHLHHSPFSPSPFAATGGAGGRGRDALPSFSSLRAACTPFPACSRCLLWAFRRSSTYSLLPPPLIAVPAPLLPPFYTVAFLSSLCALLPTTDRRLVGRLPAAAPFTAVLPATSCGCHLFRRALLPQNVPTLLPAATAYAASCLPAACHAFCRCPLPAARLLRMPVPATVCCACAVLPLLPLRVPAVLLFFAAPCAYCACWLRIPRTRGSVYRVYAPYLLYRNTFPCTTLK